MRPKTLAAAMALAGPTLLGVAAASPAHAAFSFVFNEYAGFVTGNGHGSIDTSALTLSGNSAISRGMINASLGRIGVSDGFIRLDLYAGASGPAQFGIGGPHFAQVSNGTGFTFSAINGEIGVPAGYVSRTGLTGNLLFPGETYASLGLTVGTYVYTWGSGATADSLTVQVLAPGTVVPEPGSLWMLLAGLLPLVAVRRRPAR